MIVFDVVVILDQVMVMVIFRVGRREMRIQWRRGRHDRRSIYEVVWWLVFCAEAHVAYEIALSANFGAGRAVRQNTPSMVTRAAPRPSSPRNLRTS